MKKAWLFTDESGESAFFTSKRKLNNFVRKYKEDLKNFARKEDLDIDVEEAYEVVEFPKKEYINPTYKFWIDSGFSFD